MTMAIFVLFFIFLSRVAVLKDGVLQQCDTPQTL